MNNTYIDLVKQTFDFPQNGFEVKNGRLFYHGIDMEELAQKYGTPMKITYLPKIGEQIEKAKEWFRKEIKKQRYKGDYYYCYCTKSSHFSFIMEEALKHDIHIETSYTYDLNIIHELVKKGVIDKTCHIVCNGYKNMAYTKGISKLINAGFKNITPILDNKEEFNDYEKYIKTQDPVNIGIRVATNEEPSFDFYTSRLGIRQSDILEFFVDRIKGQRKFRLKMLHFFMNKGIKDDIYYWSELNKVVTLYCQLKKICPELDSINIGGGFPIQQSMAFDYDYEYMVQEIISNIKSACKTNKVEMPDIYTEFGSFTVGESGAVLYSVAGEKTQNDSESWYMIDSSFITTLPDTWGLGQKFMLLPLNYWENEYQEVHLGGMTCDSQDYYTSEEYTNAVFLPKPPRKKNLKPLMLGFFHTGAYQDQLAGYGGIKHCMIPSPKHVLITKDENGNHIDRLYAKEQTVRSMMKILGYK